MNNLKVGDLARVVKWPCCGQGLGSSMLITTIFPQPFIRVIMDCCNRGISIGYVAIDQSVPTDAGYLVSCPLDWLEKIDDLPETVEDRETIEA